MSLLLLFVSSGTADDFCGLRLEDGDALLTEAGEFIVGENCAVTPPTPTTTGRQAFRAQPGIGLLLWIDDEEALIVMET